jgi:hypothetical protein
MNVEGLKLPSTLANDFLLNEIEAYLHLFIMLYADDTVILTETEGDMRTALRMLENYCIIWGLKVNVDKTKIMIFFRGKVRKLPMFVFNNKRVEIVFEYKNLGVLFNYNNRFSKAQKDRCTLANKAMFSLLKKCRQLNLPLDVQLELF